MLSSGSSAIIGIGEAGIGRAGEGFDSLDLMGLAAADAMSDAGLAPGDIDGLFCTSSHYAMNTLEAGEYLGITPRFTDATNIGGASFVSHLLHAAAAIEAGLCRNALIVYGSTQLSDSGGLQSASTLNRSEQPFQPRYPVSMYAMATARHMHEYGTTRTDLARVAIAARDWAQLTPGAYRPDPMTIEEALESRMVSSPLSVVDCCLVTDGAGAVVITDTTTARTVRDDFVPVLGAAEKHWHRSIGQMPDLMSTAARITGPLALERASRTLADVDFMQLYDAFTINVILFLEDLGVTPPGQATAFIRDEGIGPGGRLPVNTNGGGLAYCHPGMYGIFLIIEAVRQLRGTAGERQVPDSEIGLIHGNGAVLSGQATAILGCAGSV